MQGKERLDHLRKIIAGNADLTREYIVMNLLSTVVASYGLLQNSTAVVIGAMIIAMLLGPINGLALALNDGNIRLLRRAGTAETVGAIVVLTTSALIGKLHISMVPTAEMLARTAPNILDLFIALAGGAAGAYAVVSPKLKSSVVGVAIATALVPPLSTCGILFARGDLRLAAGAFILFITNLVTIQAAAAAVFWVFGLHTSVKKEKSFLELCKRNGVTLGLMFGLAVFLWISFKATIHTDTLQRQIEKEIGALTREINEGIAVTEVNVNELTSQIDIYAVFQTPASFTPEMVLDLENKLTAILEKPANLTVRSIISKEANDTAYLHIEGSTENTASPPPGIGTEAEPIKPKTPEKQPSEQGSAEEEGSGETTTDDEAGSSDEGWKPDVLGGNDPPISTFEQGAE